MTTERIKQIQEQTAYPNSVSVKQALLQVWNECEQEQLRLCGVGVTFCECEGVQDLHAMTGECRKCGKECDY